MEETVHAMAWLHDAAGIPSPTANPFIAVVLDGLRITLAKPVSKSSFQHKDTYSHGTGWMEQLSLMDGTLMVQLNLNLTEHMCSMGLT